MLSRAHLFAFIVAVVAAGSARAQQPILPLGEPATQSVYNPSIALSGIGDASSTVKNPAMMASIKSWSLVYLHTERPGNGVVGGRGDGVYFAAPVPLFSNFATGMSLESVRPPSTFSWSSTGKFTSSVSYKPMPFLSVGFLWAYLWRDQGKEPGNHNTFDLSLAGNVGRFFAYGLVIHDISTPTIGGVPVQRVYDFEISYRPWGNDRFEIAGGTRIGERRRDVDPHFRVWMTPFQGFHIKAELEWRRDVDLDGINENDVRAALGLELDLGKMSVGGYGLFGRELGVNKGQGFSLVARMSGENYAPPWDAPLHLERIEFDGELKGITLVQVLRRLRKIEREPTTVGVLVHIGDLAGGWATAESLRAALIRLREKQKHVFVVMSAPSSRAYYVAAVAQRIFLSPAGGVDLKGLHSTAIYFKGTGELLGVKADFVKIGEFKSAPEQFTDAGASPAARAQRDAFVDDVYHNLIDGIAAGRNIDPELARKWIDDGPYTAAEALRHGLVDELVMPTQLGAALDRALGKHVPLMATSRTPEHQRIYSPPRIAVLAIDGDITEGETQTIPLLDKKLTGMKTTVRTIEQVRDDASVRALVLYIDSPGGSALASDTIADALRTLKDRKPIICALGDVAASGGYFIASVCDKIYAAPSTLTGSIGIFTGKFDISGLAGKLGVTHEFYDRGAHAGIESLWRPYTDEERALLADKLRYYYDRFVDAVALGRGLDRRAVDELGRGHIWSGRAAQARHLVDAFGGIAEALEDAAAECGLPANEYEVQYLPEEKTLLFKLLGYLGINLKGDRPSMDLQVATQLLTRVLGQLPASLLLAPSTPQARLDAMQTIE